MPKSYYVYSETYKIECRAAWYQHECPSPRRTVELNILPEDEQGKKADETALTRWMKEDSWSQWADGMNADLSVRVEEKLLQNRVALIEEQLEQNKKIRDKAFEEIRENGFDSSAAAVSAFFKSSAEERGLMQVQKVIEDLARLESGDLQKKFRDLARRADATAIEGEVIPEKEEVAEPLD